MCGIVGYVGKDEKCTPILLNALKHLEYRGYDSAGIATISDGIIHIRKDAGMVESVATKHSFLSLPGSTGIAHTRWATHGSPSQWNAHPHTDCTGQVAIVQNGIIENYQELKRELVSRGHKFSSETDTEVIAHLIEENLGNASASMQASGSPEDRERLAQVHINNSSELVKAVQAAGKSLRGLCSFLAVSSKEPDRIVATRMGCPLVVGIGDGKFFAASDVLSFIEHTNKVVFLEDGESAILEQSGVSFFGADGVKIEKAVNVVDWSPEAAAKGGHAHFAIKEIMEEPVTIRQALVQDKAAINEMASEILAAKRVIITACGTSRYAALVGRYLFSKMAKRYGDVMMASEFHYFADSVDKDTLVIAVSQSGETADVMEGVRQAKKRGAKVFSIVNAVGSSLTRMSDRVIYMNCGPEIGVAATKSFINELAIFYMLAFAMVGRLDEGIGKINDIASKIETSIHENTETVIGLSQKLSSKNDFYYIARGINFAIAAEGSLKLKELSYIHAEGMPAGELKHGTMALIENGTPVVVICPKDYTFHETLGNAAETKARGAFVIGVSDEHNDIYDAWIKIPKVDEIFYPLATMAPLQLLSYHMAVAKGRDPDRPRNLAKSCTVK